MSPTYEAIITALSTVSQKYEPTHVLFINPAMANRLTDAWYETQQADEFVVSSPWHEGGRVEHDGDVCEVSICAWVNDGKVYKWARDVRMPSMATF